RTPRASSPGCRGGPPAPGPARRGTSSVRFSFDDRTPSIRGDEPVGAALCGRPDFFEHAGSGNGTTPTAQGGHIGPPLHPWIGICADVDYPPCLPTPSWRRPASPRPTATEPPLSRA